MTRVLHLDPQPDVPIACDMSAARDTPEERLRDYHDLFERALQRRERTPDAVLFVFRAGPDTRSRVDDLARREAACCPFLDYRVESVGEEVIWTTTNPVLGDNRTKVDVILDALHDLPDHAGSDLAAYLERLSDRGVHVTETAGRRFELGR